MHTVCQIDLLTTLLFPHIHACPQANDNFVHYSAGIFNDLDCNPYATNREETHNMGIIYLTYFIEEDNVMSKS